MHSRGLALTLALAIGATGLTACGGEGGASGEASVALNAPIPVRTVVATMRDEPITLSLDGTLLADEASDVTSVVQGRVVEVLVERGAHVEEGDVLVRLRDVDFRLAARSARAQLNQARARLGIGADGEAPSLEETTDVRAARTDMELAASNLARSEALAERGVLSDQALEQTRAAAASSRERYEMALNGARGSIAALQGARATLAQASTATSDATIRAPFSGEIAARHISVGEFVSPQTPIVSLVRTDPLRMEVSVPQQNVLSVRAGQAVGVRVDAAEGRTFEGTVRYVSAAVERATRGLTVEAVVPNADGVLRPGLFATARIAIGGSRELAQVPEGAILRRAGVDRVFVVQGGHIVERIATIADRLDDGSVLIEEGLSAGEAVVAFGDLEQLADGMAVTATPSDAPAPGAEATPTAANVPAPTPEDDHR